ncbi:MAG: hypothetical protein ACE5H9_17780 [Anaerolineae bacterium]
MANAMLEGRVTNLEEMIADLTQVVARTSQSVEQLSRDLRAYREEWRAELQTHREEWQAELRASRERTEADLQAYREEWRAEARQMNRHWGELANKMGTLTEDLVAPSLPRILRAVIACPEDEVVSIAVRVRRAHPVERGLGQEFDVVVSCGEYALFNETKSNLTPADVDILLVKLASARDYFPEYRDYKLLGSVASLYVDASLVRYASRQGVLVLAVGDELMDVQNETGFRPQTF